jgi:acyl-CoA synthetase (AMP-forming)/AMP-acid ligase II
VPTAYPGSPTRATFPVVNGVRYAVLGDLARLEDDGSIVVLGQGATCINSGGEEVFAEKAEQTLKSHPAVLDALVADERLGERVAAVVQLRADITGPDAEELREHCRATLAGYKVPVRIEFVEHAVRSPTGKADYHDRAGCRLRVSRAGVGVGTVYRRFASKDALIDELLRLVLAGSCSARPTPPPSARSPQRSSN